VSRYRTIDIRMHGDAVIQSLSRPQPNGRSLWDHLLYGPSTGIIPGLYRAREAQLADELRWEREPFRKCFAELSTARSRLGFEGVLVKADWVAGLLWVPNGVKYNAPANPNVVKGWAHPFDELPECELKAEAYGALRTHCAKRGKLFAEAFERLPKPFPGGSPNGMANQDQDQDQDQDQELRTRARRAATKPARANGEPEETGERPVLGGGLAQEVREGWAEAYFEAKAGAPPRLIGKQLEAAILFADDVARTHCKQPREAARAIAAATLTSGEKDVRTWGLTKLDPYAAPARDVRRGVLRPTPASGFTATNLDDLFGADKPPAE
jgi:hypothetical protein